MRLIEEQMNQAILNKTDWHKDNTEVIYDRSVDQSYVYLHGHNIATYDHF